MMSSSRPSLALPSPDKTSANKSSSLSRRNGDQDGLNQALAVFQATLTDDERAKLQSLKGTSCDADSVITFTADLDRVNFARKGRSIATRLFSLLQIVQQFNQTVDTYVSSHPEIAALVWGSVKLAFTVLANFTSYFQQFSELLRGFDRLCPVFAEYRLLFPNSARLRDATYGFHTSVICCCSQIMIATRKPWQQQLLGAVVQSFHGELKPYVDDVRLKAEHVQAEISLAKARADQAEHLSQAEERRQAAETRKGLAKWFSQSEKQVRRLRQASETADKERKWEALLAKLSSYDHASAFKIAREKRHQGTAEWVFDENQFQEWYTCEKSSMIHMMGKIGSGKTILTANVVDYLIKHRRPRQVVSFFFVCFDLSASMKCEQILRSLIRQALDQLSTIDTDDTLLPPLEAANESFFERSSLLDLWSKKASSVDELFIVFDGFDECSATERKAFLNALVTMNQACNGSTRVKTLISSRESIRQEVVLCDSACFTLTLGSDTISHDLSRYVSEIISEKLLAGELKLEDPFLAKDIIREISLGGEGMFLWVSLTIEDICSRHTDSKIREALDHIPRKLPETFDRALQRIIANGNDEIAQNIFKWTAVVRQPLKLEQLREALSVEPRQEYSRPDRFVNGIHRLSVWCENLVQIEYSDDTVRFSHHSIRKYLLEPASGPIQSFHFDYDGADSNIGSLCLTYLNFNDFKSALMDPKKAFKNLPVVNPADLAGTAVKSAVPGSSGARIARLVRRSFGKSTPYSGPIPPTSSQATSPGNTATVVQTEYPFFEYAKSHWYMHRLSSTTSTRRCKMLLWTMVESEHAPWWDPEWRPPGIRAFNRREWLDYLADDSRLPKVGKIPPDFSASDVALHKAVAGEQDAVLAAYYALKHAIWYHESTAMDFLLEFIESMATHVEAADLDFVFRLLITKSYLHSQRLLDHVNIILGHEESRGGEALSQTLFEAVRRQKWDLAIMLVSFRARLDFVVNKGSALDVLSTFFNSALKCATSSTEGEGCASQALVRVAGSILLYCSKHIDVAKRLVRSLKDECFTYHILESLSLYQSLELSVVQWKQEVETKPTVATRSWFARRAQGRYRL
ncbi:Vegetative incompatibility protein HET-E-1 [Colletotrichum tanaceti]|uniref:Vegetative incompatibility protein HET-E-1 n=1 Tax=Colletotrichum tanaceti TaxID=1306861 RepID=A0A4U6XHY8_9PEZI|nr:Vegetative incompatibility protein HET-E-1 [Colletotrichum tanaceti]TKW55143.1 Vegetative incompatibility protein HET-E-1 [Colletotrichum tanaceti]